MEKFGFERVLENRDLLQGRGVWHGISKMQLPFSWGGDVWKGMKGSTRGFPRAEKGVS